MIIQTFFFFNNNLNQSEGSVFCSFNFALLKKNSGDCTNCGNTTEATTLQQFIKKKVMEIEIKKLVVVPAYKNFLCKNSPRGRGHTHTA